MKYDLLLTGVGGQGILTLSAILGKAALADNFHVKQSEVHGMAQRGGAVFSHFRMSEERIASDLIPTGKADLILALEPLEGLRYLSYLKEDGWLISASNELKNIKTYPETSFLHDKIKNVPNHLIVDGATIARENGLARAQNIAMLAAAGPLLPLDKRKLKNAIADFFNSKGEDIIQKNIDIFDSGYQKGFSEIKK
jgi:indolepyruvate ferredoxin oxidoreductase beta subunit